MKIDSQMQAELIKPDRCRLQLIPLVDSNPVMKAGRHQSLWQLYLGPEVGWGLGTPLLCHYCNSWVQTRLIWTPSTFSPLFFSSNARRLILQHLTMKSSACTLPPRRRLSDDTSLHGFVGGEAVAKEEPPNTCHPTGPLCLQPTYHTSLSNRSVVFCCFYKLLTHVKDRKKTHNFQSGLGDVRSRCLSSSEWLWRRVVHPQWRQMICVKTKWGCKTGDRRLNVWCYSSSIRRLWRRPPELMGPAESRSHHLLLLSTSRPSQLPFRSVLFCSCCLEKQQVRNLPLPLLSYAPSKWCACSNLPCNRPQRRLWPFANSWKKNLLLLRRKDLNNAARHKKNDLHRDRMLTRRFWLTYIDIRVPDLQLFGKSKARQEQLQTETQFPAFKPTDGSLWHNSSTSE